MVRSAFVARGASVAVLLCGCSQRGWSHDSEAATPGGGSLVIQRVDDRFVPDFGGRPARLQMQIALRGDGPSRVGSRNGRVATDVVLEGARPVLGRVEGGRIVHEGVLGEGTSREHRVRPGAVEDFVTFARAPAEETLRFSFSTEHVAGLRQIAGSSFVELLDDEGTPRLRVAAPYGIDAAGARFAARSIVRGCALDTSTRPPWGRKPIAPGAERCTLEVSWQRSPELYPVTIDPAWTDTGDLSRFRMRHLAPALLDGRALVFGGTSESNPPTQGDLFDPGTKTFALTGPYQVWAYGAARLLDGRVLAVGSVGQVFDPATGSFTELSGFGDARDGATVELLPDGRALVAGGITNLGGLSSTRLFDPAAPGGGAWSDGPPMAFGHASATSARMPDGRIVVVERSKPVEVFDPNAAGGAGAWSTVSALVDIQVTALAVLGTRVLVVGVEVQTSARTSRWLDLDVPPFLALHPGPQISLTFDLPTTLAMPDGSALLLDGIGPNSQGSLLRLIRPGWASFVGLPSLNARRDGGQLTRLTSGAILATGGIPDEMTSELCEGSECTTPAAQATLGQGCSNDSDCGSSHCSHGICCATVCDGPCVTCDPSESVGGGTGGSSGAGGSGGSSGSGGASQAGLGICRAVSKGLLGHGCTPFQDDCSFAACDGLGSCGTGFVPIGTRCPGTMCDTANVFANGCDGQGVCKASYGGVDKLCAPFGCSGDVCKTTCQQASDCAPGNDCQNGVCLGNIGTFCSDGAACASGICGPLHMCAVADGGACSLYADCKSQCCPTGTCEAYDVCFANGAGGAQDMMATGGGGSGGGLGGASAGGMAAAGGAGIGTGGSGGIGAGGGGIGAAGGGIGAGGAGGIGPGGGGIGGGAAGGGRAGHGGAGVAGGASGSTAANGGTGPGGNGGSAVAGSQGALDSDAANASSGGCSTSAPPGSSGSPLGVLLGLTLVAWVTRSRKAPSATRG